MLVVAALAMVLAFKDPCAGQAVQVGFAKCKSTFRDHLPGPSPLIAMAIVCVSMLLFYEFRWYLRVWATGAIGMALLGMAAAIVLGDVTKVLAVVSGVVGLALVASAYGIHIGHRGAWSLASSACGVLALVFFFGSARLRAELHLHLAWAVLPSLAVFLPACVMLGTSPPGGEFYEPFASAPRGQRPRSAPQSKT
jgi:hypothetical protein